VFDEVAMSERERLIELVRCLNDLADVTKDIGAAARLVAERLEQMECQLVGLLAQEERQDLH